MGKEIGFPNPYLIQRNDNDRLYPFETPSTSLSYLYVVFIEPKLFDSIDKYS